MPSLPLHGNDCLLIILQSKKQNQNVRDGQLENSIPPTPQTEFAVGIMKAHIMFFVHNYENNLNTIFSLNIWQDMP